MADKGSGAHPPIRRIDVPVTPASLQPDSKLVAIGEKPVSRMPVKTLVKSAIYAVVGLAVLSYTALLQGFVGDNIDAYASDGMFIF